MSPALDLGHLNDLNDDVVVEVDVEEAQKSLFMVIDWIIFIQTKDDLS